MPKDCAFDGVPAPIGPAPWHSGEKVGKTNFNL
jgi:hypothetical protein